MLVMMVRPPLARVPPPPLTLSICWYSLLEGWWMLVMMVRPPLARVPPPPLTLSICWYSLLEGWWMLVMMVRPPLARVRSVCMRLRAVVESSPEVGCRCGKGGGRCLRCV